MKEPENTGNLHEVFKTQESPPNEYMKENVENMDRIKKDTMKSSKKHCRILWLGKVDFIPTKKN